jgi:hypothetical protein
MSANVLTYAIHASTSGTLLAQTLEKLRTASAFIATMKLRVAEALEIQAQRKVIASCAKTEIALR